MDDNTAENTVSVFGQTEIIPAPVEITFNAGNTVLFGDVGSCSITELGYVGTGTLNNEDHDREFMIPFAQVQRIELFSEAYDKALEAMYEAEADELVAEYTDTAESVQADQEVSDGDK
jgi:hypothetical protein